MIYLRSHSGLVAEKGPTQTFSLTAQPASAPFHPTEQNSLKTLANYFLGIRTPSAQIEGGSQG